jgi:hypothetical protein
MLYGGCGVPTGGGSTPKFLSYAKAQPNSQFRGIYIRNNLIRIRVPFICKMSGTPDRGLPPPDPHSLCPLASTELVEHPPPPPNFWVCHCIPYYMGLYMKDVHYTSQVASMMLLTVAHCLFNKQTVRLVTDFCTDCLLAY